MNEREFLRKLNKDGNNTLIIISKLLEEEKSSKSNILEKFNSIENQSDYEYIKSYDTRK